MLDFCDIWCNARTLYAEEQEVKTLRLRGSSTGMTNIDDFNWQDEQGDIWQRCYKNSTVSDKSPFDFLEWSAVVKDIQYVICEGDDEIVLPAWSAHVFNNFWNMCWCDLSKISISQLTALDGFFANCYELRDGSNMPLKDEYGYHFNTLEIINTWSNPNITSARYMFYSCGIVDIDISGMYIPSVEDVNSMFHSCSELKSVKLFYDPNQPTRQMPYLKNCREMFKNCPKLQRVNLTDWKFSPIAESYFHMFSWCYELESLGDDSVNPILIPMSETLIYSGYDDLAIDTGGVGHPRAPLPTIVAVCPTSMENPTPVFEEHWYIWNGKLENVVYVKVNDSWYRVEKIYFKNGEAWQEVECNRKQDNSWVKYDGEVS